MSIITLRFIQVVAWSIIVPSFLLLAVFHGVDVPQFIHLLSEGQLVGYSFWLLQIKLQRTSVYRYLHKHVFISLGQISRSVIAGHMVSFMVNFVKNCQTIFQSGYTILHSHRNVWIIQFFLILVSTWYCQYFSILVIWIDV